MARSEPAAPCVALIDADTAVQALLKEVLASVNLRVQCWPANAAANPDELAGFLSALAPAAVLLDIPPPYAQHWQVALRLRSRLPQLPFLLLTTDAAALHGLPGNDGRLPILTKPFEIETLLSAVQTVAATEPE